jgi:thiol-disulfide isomerase/thioredoxin
MNTRTLLFAGAAFVAAAIFSPAFAADAEADFAAFNTLKAAKPPASPKEMGVEKYYRWMDDARRQTQAAGLAFISAHGTDPRRWEVVQAIAGSAPLYIKSIGDDVEKRGPAAIVADEDAKAAWEKRADELRRALLAAPDAAPKLKEEVDWYYFAKDFRATSAAKTKGEKYDYAPFRPRFAAHVAKYADLPNLGARAGDYLGALEKNVSGASLAEWKLHLNSPNESLRTRAATEIKKVEALQKPLEIAFTAADGRAVDLAKLRGKVVLIDFWATWCGPCIAEIPNLKRVYEAYHDKGFEVVGISFENARVTKDDAPDVVAKKKAEAKAKMLAFAQEKGLPWPQHFDGEYWGNEFGKRFDIRGIPAMYLLDKDGRVVDTSARGEKLEPAVRKLLGLN